MRPVPVPPRTVTPTQLTAYLNTVEAREVDGVAPTTLRLKVWREDAAEPAGWATNAPIQALYETFQSTRPDPCRDRP